MHALVSRWCLHYWKMYHSYMRRQIGQSSLKQSKTSLTAQALWGTALDNMLPKRLGTVAMTASSALLATYHGFIMKSAC